MSFANRFAEVFKKVLPSPFTIAIGLTLMVMVLAFLLPNTTPSAEISSVHLNHNQDSLVIEAQGASTYQWSNGMSGSRIVVPYTNGPVDITLKAGNHTDNYESEIHIVYQAPNEELAVEDESSHKLWQLLSFWNTEMWNANLLAFLVQMMLMLVLGHVLALSQPVDRFIGHLTELCTNNTRSVVIVSFLTILVSLFNWGLGLIFGAIFARKVGEQAAKKLTPINYAMVGAAGYVGLMVWHGGISGSAPIKVSEPGSMSSLMTGRMSTAELANLPDFIPFEMTVFSTMNLVISIVLLFLIPLTFYLISKRTSKAVPQLATTETWAIESTPQTVNGAEKLDHSRWFGSIIGWSLLLFCIYKAYLAQSNGFNLKFINPNYINLSLLALCFIFHARFTSFLRAAEEAIKGTTGILLQFPLYFGILGLMKGSGLMNEISEFFVANSNQTSYPLYTFFSAGLVNIFVPSGGGQWAVQGPIVVEAASNIGVPLNKSIMALAYGDQLTNMLQPFWALPLLGITGLKAKQILPYTLLIMLVGAGIFILGLLLF